MKKIIFTMPLLISMFSFSQQPNVVNPFKLMESTTSEAGINCEHTSRTSKFPKEVWKQMKKGKHIDTNVPVYLLPYREGTSHPLIQGYYGFPLFGTHNGQGSFALDFRMPEGTEICAARDGIVIKVVDTITVRGCGETGNHLIIKHSDGSRARYDHLKFKGLIVKLGDQVKAGQTIAYSGFTGHTYTPHLHFIVYKCDETGWYSIPTPFFTENGPAYIFKKREYESIR